MGVMVGVIEGCKVGVTVGICGRVGAALSLRITGVKTGAGVSSATGRVRLGVVVPSWREVVVRIRRRRGEGAAGGRP